jgi:L,D-transpeptidase YcbB
VNNILSRGRAGSLITLLIVAVSPQRLAPKCETTLRQLVAVASLSDLRWPDFSNYQLQVIRFYEAGDYAPAWIRRGDATTQAVTIIEALRGANDKGLDAEDYDASRWATRLEGLRQARPRPTELDLARFDLALTVSAMRYVSDLHIGKVNPKLVHLGLDIEHKKFDLATFLRQRVVNALDVQETLSRVEPPFAGYQRLQKALQAYIALANEDDGALLPATRKPVELGDLYSGCARLTHLLRRFGDLPADSTTSSGVYGEALAVAVKRFQARHGLDTDGRIGRATLEQLNTPLRRRVRQLQLTLERWRWVPHEFATPPIVVNIPEFQLRAFNSSYRTELEMNVVVGRAYRTQTPVFMNNMRYVIFRPYWNVPRSIQRGELTPKIARDHSYLTKNGYEIVDSHGETIPGATISDQMLHQLRSGQVAIRQLPGPKNALGLVKFMFPNEYNVYMHDTPSTELFSKPRRDFSHGCIRVQAPEDLAVWVLRNKPEWTRQRIRDAMNGAKTIQVNLDSPIPVLIVYGTAVAPESGEARFLADIYGHDASLERLLEKGYPYSDGSLPIPNPAEIHVNEIGP